MRNIHDVLKQKEIELLQVQKEIEALRLAARLLADESESYSQKPLAAPVIAAAGQAARSTQAIANPAPPLPGYSPNWDAAAKKFP